MGGGGAYNYSSEPLDPINKSTKDIFLVNPSFGIKPGNGSAYMDMWVSML